MRFGIHVAVLGLGLGLGACAGPQRASEPVSAPADLGTPGCRDGDPSVKIVRAQRGRCAKGDACTTLDLQIRNPESQTLWLLVDARTEFSGYVESVNILQDTYVRDASVWELAGQGRHLALRLAPDADVLIRNLEYSGSLTEFSAVFFDRIVLTYDRQIDGLTPGGIVPERGEFDMQWLSHPDYERRKVQSLEDKERVSLGKWCAQTVPLPK